MTEEEQTRKLFDLFNQEQGTFSYYTCGLLTVIIGYMFNLIINIDKPHIYLLFIAIGIMFFSLFCGIYFIKYRLSNYYNNGHILYSKSQTKEQWKHEVCKELIEKNSKAQSLWYKLHWWTIFIGPIIIFVWSILVFNK